MRWTVRLALPYTQRIAYLHWATALRCCGGFLVVYIGGDTLAIPIVVFYTYRLWFLPFCSGEFTIWSGEFTIGFGGENDVIQTFSRIIFSHMMHFRPISDQNILDEGYNSEYNIWKSMGQSWYEWYNAKHFIAYMKIPTFRENQNTFFLIMDMDIFLWMIIEWAMLNLYALFILDIMMKRHATCRTTTGCSLLHRRRSTDWQTCPAAGALPASKAIQISSKFFFFFLFKNMKIMILSNLAQNI